MPEKQDDHPPRLSSYPLKDFREDFEWCASTNLGKHPIQAVADYFAKRYPLGTADERMGRCLAAASYWQNNMESLNAGNLAVVGDKKSLVRGRLIVVMWLCWCKEDNDWKTYNPPVDAIIDVAEGLKNPK